MKMKANSTGTMYVSGRITYGTYGVSVAFIMPPTSLLLTFVAKYVTGVLSVAMVALTMLAAAVMAAVTAELKLLLFGQRCVLWREGGVVKRSLLLPPVATGTRGVAKAVVEKISLECMAFTRVLSRVAFVSGLRGVVAFPTFGPMSLVIIFSIVFLFVVSYFMLFSFSQSLDTS